MMKRSYLVQVESHLNIEQAKILNYFYQPLIGSTALSLYRFFLEEEQFLKSVNFNLDLERIYQFLNFNDETLRLNLKLLEKFDLLKIHNWKLINKSDIDKIIFHLKTPLSAPNFLKSLFFEEFKIKVSNDILEQIYYWLRPTKFVNFTNKNSLVASFNFADWVYSKKDSCPVDNFQEEDFNSETTIASLNSLKSLKKVNYQLKNQDIALIQNLLAQKVSFETIKIILDFTIFRINSFSYKYFFKLIKTLQEKQLLFSYSETKRFFQNLYQKLPWENNKKNINFFPLWLDQSLNLEINKKSALANKSDLINNVNVNLDWNQFDKLF